MKKSSKSKSTAPKVDPYLEGLMAKLLERLVGLERKMDTVISQTGGKVSSHEPPKASIQVPQRRERQLYEAICADCHKVCEVPFKPTEARPVYCKQCFAKRKGGGSGPAFPVLTPVALPPKPVSKLHLPASVVSPTRVAAKKSKKKKK